MTKTLTTDKTIWYCVFVWSDARIEKGCVVVKDWLPDEYKEQPPKQEIHFYGYCSSPGIPDKEQTYEGYKIPVSLLSKFFQTSP